MSNDESLLRESFERNFEKRDLDLEWDVDGDMSTVEHRSDEK